MREIAPSQFEQCLKTASKFFSYTGFGCFDSASKLSREVWDVVWDAVWDAAALYVCVAQLPVLI